MMTRQQNATATRTAVSAAGLAVGWLYLAGFTAYFFSLTLPNSHVARYEVWLWSLGLLPGWAPPLVEAISQLVGSSHLHERLRPLFVALAAYATVLAAGQLAWSALERVFGRQNVGGISRLTLVYALGSSIVSSITLLLGLLGLLQPWLFRCAAGVTALAGAASWSFDRQKRTRQRQHTGGQHRPVAYLVVGCGAVAGLLILAGAVLPATDFDVREYHLQGPKEYFLAGRIHFLPHNVYTNMPFGTEMLSLFCMVLDGDWWWGALAGQLLLAAFPVMAVVAAAATAGVAFGVQAAWWAALVGITTPWIYRLGIIPYAEGGYLFYTTAALLALAHAWRWRDEMAESVAWLLAGWCAGAAYGTKYTAAVFVVLPVLAAAAFSVKRRALWLAGLAVLAASFLWPLKNVLYTGNPVYPLAYEIFGGRNWDEAKDEKWDKGHSVPGYRWPQLRRNLVDVTAMSDWQSVLVFGLAPAAWLAGPRRRVALLWGAVLFLFACWWLLTHRIDRFWLPLLGPAFALAGAGAASLGALPFGRGLLLVTAGSIAYFNLSLMASPLSGNNAYGSPLDDRLRDPLNTATGMFVKYANTRLLPEDRILAVGAADLFHLDRPYAYNTVFDDCLFEQWTRGLEPHEAARKLRSLGFTYLFVCWEEVDRYRKTYGYTEYVSPGLFRRFEREGALLVEYRFGEPIPVEEDQVPRGVLYRIPAGPRSETGR